MCKVIGKLALQRQDCKWTKEQDNELSFGEPHSLDVEEESGVMHRGAV